MQHSHYERRIILNLTESIDALLRCLLRESDKKRLTFELLTDGLFLYKINQWRNQEKKGRIEIWKLVWNFQFTIDILILAWLVKSKIINNNHSNVKKFSYKWASAYKKVISFRRFCILLLFVSGNQCIVMEYTDWSSLNFNSGTFFNWRDKR